MREEKIERAWVTKVVQDIVEFIGAIKSNIEEYGSAIEKESRVENGIGSKMSNLRLLYKMEPSTTELRAQVTQQPT
jgi:hypothetical protein